MIAMKFSQDGAKEAAAPNRVKEDSKDGLDSSRLSVSGISGGTLGTAPCTA